MTTQFVAEKESGTKCGKKEIAGNGSATTVQFLRRNEALNEDRDVRRSLDSLKQATNLMMSTARGVLTAAPDLLPPLLFEPASLVEIADGVCRGYTDIARRKRVRILWKAPAKSPAVGCAVSRTPRPVTAWPWPAT